MHGISRKVIAQFEYGIGKKECEFMPQREGVVYRFADLAFGQHGFLHGE